MGVDDGNPTRVESADGSSPSDHRFRPTAAAEAVLQRLRSLAREARDEGANEVAQRIEANADRVEREIQQRGVDGEDSQDARKGKAEVALPVREALACSNCKMIVLPYEGRLSCGCGAASGTQIDLNRKPNWLIEGRATQNGRLV